MGEFLADRSVRIHMLSLPVEGHAGFAHRGLMPWRRPMAGMWLSYFLQHKSCRAVCSAEKVAQMVPREEGVPVGRVFRKGEAILSAQSQELMLVHLQQRPDYFPWKVLCKAQH